MNKYLTQKIWEMRKNIKTIEGTPKVSIVKVEAKNYQMLFTSCGCDNACSFCNYGFDYNLTLETVKPELEKIHLENIEIKDLQLEANGSFLSEREIPYELFVYVLEFVAHKGIPTISFETHYKTITEEKIKTIKRILGENQQVCFELGFESSDEKVRKVYNKDIDNDRFIEVTKLCAKYNIELFINVLLGAPFLSREEQIQDCLRTLDFIYEKMPVGTSAVLFPINIKENTLLKYWESIGIYSQISSWEFIEFLHRIPEKYLDKLTIAWWGERENTYTKGITQFPKVCDKCKERLLEFYRKFYSNWNPLSRKKMIEEIWKTRCDCDK